MELENELFLATIEWTWECCLKQKESDNEKSVALCKAYKGVPSRFMRKIICRLG